MISGWLYLKKVCPSGCISCVHTVVLSRNTVQAFLEPNFLSEKIYYSLKLWISFLGIIRQNLKNLRINFYNFPANLWFFEGNSVMPDVSYDVFPWQQYPKLKPRPKLKITDLSVLSVYRHTRPFGSPCITNSIKMANMASRGNLPQICELAFGSSSQGCRETYMCLRAGRRSRELEQRGRISKHEPLLPPHCRCRTVEWVNRGSWTRWRNFKNVYLHQNNSDKFKTGFIWVFHKILWKIRIF